MREEFFNNGDLSDYIELNEGGFVIHMNTYAPTFFRTEQSALEYAAESRIEVEREHAEYRKNPRREDYDSPVVYDVLAAGVNGDDDHPVVYAVVSSETGETALDYHFEVGSDGIVYFGLRNGDGAGYRDEKGDGKSLIYQFDEYYRYLVDKKKDGTLSRELSEEMREAARVYKANRKKILSSVSFQPNDIWFIQHNRDMRAVLAIAAHEIIEERHHLPTYEPEKGKGFCDIYMPGMGYDENGHLSKDAKFYIDIIDCNDSISRRCFEKARPLFRSVMNTSKNLSFDSLRLGKTARFENLSRGNLEALIQIFVKATGHPLSDERFWDDRDRFEFGEMKFIRGNNYRSNYFKTNKGDKHGKYRCAYCGRKYKKRHVQIDHIIPVHEVSGHGKGKMYRDLLNKYHLDGVNDMRNLTTACAYCNRKKGAKTGKWSAFGFLGSTKWFWPLIHTLYAMITVAFITGGAFMTYAGIHSKRIFLTDNTTLKDIIKVIFTNPLILTGCAFIIFAILYNAYFDYRDTHYKPLKGRYNVHWGKSYSTAASGEHYERISAESGTKEVEDLIRAKKRRREKRAKDAKIRANNMLYALCDFAVTVFIFAIVIFVVVMFFKFIIF